jgi:UDP-glucose 4-epimerase
MEKPIETEETNVVGTLCLLEAALHAGVQCFVFSSTSAVYGNIEREKHSETDLPDPASPYAISKLAAEYYVTLTNGRNGMRTTSLRYFNVFGPRQDPKSPYAAAVSIFTLRALRGEPLVIYGDGLQTRDFIYVEDVVAANLVAAQKGEGVYNVGRGERLSITQLAKLIRQLTGSCSPIEHAAPRAGDVRHSCADARRLRALGWMPQVPLADGLARTIAWMKDDFVKEGKLS